MISFCNSCQKEVPFSEIRRWVAPSKSPQILRYCRDCVHGTVTFHDVYWDGKPEHNLADDPYTGKPRVFMSKGQKAAYLRERDISEAGDKVHGAPVMLHKETPRRVDSKHEVQMALKKVRDMGQDVRRQAYLKVLKEGRRHA